MPFYSDPEWFMKKEFYDLTWQFKKKRIIAEQGRRCLECGGTAEHNSKPLTLQIDHIDGDRTNGTRGNLRALCPNCHSQTLTYAGKQNIGISPKYLQSTKKVSDDDLCEIISKSSTIAIAARIAGYRRGRFFYERARKLIDEGKCVLCSKYDTHKIQDDLDSGFSWTDIKNKYGISLMTINRMKHDGKIRSRNREVGLSEYWIKRRTI